MAASIHPKVKAGISVSVVVTAALAVAAGFGFNPTGAETTALIAAEGFVVAVAGWLAPGRVTQ
jgi:hypothetical protein